MGSKDEAGRYWRRLKPLLPEGSSERADLGPAVGRPGQAAMSPRAPGGRSAPQAMLSAQPSHTDFAAGARAYDGGDYATAFREWIALARRGDTAAQAAIADLYHGGTGRPVDLARAASWYARAAEAGNTIARSIWAKYICAAAVCGAIPSPPMSGSRVPRGRAMNGRAVRATGWPTRSIPRACPRASRGGLNELAGRAGYAVPSRCWTILQGRSRHAGPRVSTCSTQTATCSSWMTS